ncbi:MAG: histidinol-phosphate transaminase [Clostridia bacterium]|nr:histidinol-phosphate transaminase [Clostridia bacterium]
MSKFFSEKFADLIPYVPGEQPKDMKYIKLNTNESPFAPSTKAQEYALDAAKKLQLYPDPDCTELREKIASLYELDKDEIVIVNGSDEILNFAFMAYCDQKTPAAFADITYGFYPVYAKINKVPYVEIPLNENYEINVEDYIGINKTIFIANPNAPTGIALPLDQIERIISSNPNNIVVVDEAYVDFGAQSAVKLIRKYDNLLVTQTFSKSRSMAGARLGMGFANKKLIQDINTLRYSTNPYNINRMTMAAGIGTIEDNEYTIKNCKVIQENREWTIQELQKLGFTTLNSKANFVFTKNEKFSGEYLYKSLKAKGVLVRYFNKERLNQFLRITIGSIDEMKILINTLKTIMEESK